MRHQKGKQKAKTATARHNVKTQTAHSGHSGSRPGETGGGKKSK